MVDFSIEQIGEDNVIERSIIDSIIVMDRNYIHWLRSDFGRSDSIEKLFSFNTDTETVTEIIAADDVSLFSLSSNSSEYVAKGSILFKAELNDMPPEDTGFYNGKSIFDIPSYSTVFSGTKTLENFATWVEGDTLFVFDAIKDSTTEYVLGTTSIYLVNNSYVDDDGDLQIRVYYPDSDDSGNSVYLFDGKEATQLGFEPKRNGIGNDLASNYEGTGVYYTFGVNSKDSKDSQVFYFYDESGSQILELSESREPFGFTASKNTAAWFERADSGTQTVYIFDGEKTKSIYEIDARDGIEDLTISGENVTWIVESSSGDELFLYDGNETTKLDDIENANFFSSSISDRFFAWVNNDDKDRTQLYWHNGEEVIQLTDSSLNQIRLNYELVDDGIIWIENIDEDISGEVFKATVDSEDLMGDVVYRFFDPGTRANVYTSDEDEIDSLIDEKYEDRGIAFNSADSLSGQPVFTFVNEDNGARIYTVDEDERKSIEDTMTDFLETDDTFYAYETQRSGTVPVYSFQNIATKGEFLTTSISSKKSLDENEDFESNGVDFYAFPEGDLT